MSIRILALALLGAGALAGQPAMAQTPQPQPVPPSSNSGVGPLTTHPSQVDRGQNMILPSAGQSGPSAAPTMVYDCKNKPQDCTTPPGPGDQRDKPQQSTPPKQ
jgi:hypothetical protein